MTRRARLLRTALTLATAGILTTLALMPSGHTAHRTAPCNPDGAVELSFPNVSGWPYAPNGYWVLGHTAGAQPLGLVHAHNASEAVQEAQNVCGPVSGFFVNPS